MQVRNLDNTADEFLKVQNVLNTEYTEEFIFTLRLCLRTSSSANVNGSKHDEKLERISFKMQD